MTKKLDIKDLSKLCKGKDDRACNALIKLGSKLHKGLAYKMDTKVKILREMQQEAKKYFTYDKDHPRRHEYFVPTPICVAGKFPCDMKTVWHFLKTYPAPTYETFFPLQPIKDGEISKLTIGKVSHKVDDNKFTIVNYTLKDHILHPGAVVRKVVKKEGIIGIATYGEGTGIMRDKNEEEAEGLWKSVDKSIIIAIATLKRK